MRFIGLLLIGATACGGAGADDDGDSDGNACPKVWTVLAGADTTAAVEDGALAIAGTNLAGADLEIRRDGLEGDFELLVTFESLVSADIGPYATVGVRDPVSDRGIYGGMATWPWQGPMVYRYPSSSSDPAHVEDNAFVPVHVQITRAGQHLTVLSGNNEGTIGIDLWDFPATGAARVWFEIGSQGAVTGLATARISDFTVTSGTGITSDTFDCDSLIH